MLRRFFSGGRAEPKPPESIAIDFAKIGGHPELEHLFITPSDGDVARAYDAWRWIGLEGLAFVAISAFGDAFLRAQDGSINFLDTLEGKLSHIAESLPQFAASLQESEKRDTYLMAGLVIGARERGLILEPSECYDFVVAPILGGEVSVDAMQKLSFVVKVSLAGQIHEQVKDLPEGTRISGFEITD